MIYLNSRLIIKAIKILTLSFCFLGFSAFSSDKVMGWEKEIPVSGFLERGFFEEYTSGFNQEDEPLYIKERDPLELIKKLRITPFRFNLVGQELAGSELGEMGPVSSTLYGLDLSDNNLSLGGLKDLSSFTELRFLNLAGNHLKDEHLSPLLSLTKLTQLILTYNKISTSGLFYLSQMNLHALDISSIHWDNKKFIYVISLFSQLKNLNVSLCNLDDNCLDCFKKMKNLEYINISRNQFTSSSFNNFLLHAKSRGLTVIY